MAKKRTKTNKSQVAKAEDVKQGRPETPINWTTVKSMCQMFCTQKEIADALGFSISTLSKRCKDEFGITFQEFSKSHKALGRCNLRRAQYKAAMAGDTMMMRHLGKYELGQRDAVPTNESTDAPPAGMQLNGRLYDFANNRFYGMAEDADEIPYADTGKAEPAQDVDYDDVTDEA